MGQQPERFDLKAISRAAVVDRSGARIGKVGELLFNPEEDSIEFVRLLIDSKNGSRLEVVVPWSQFRLSDDQQHLQLNISPAVLIAVARRRHRD